MNWILFLLLLFVFRIYFKFSDFFFLMGAQSRCGLMCSFYGLKLFIHVFICFVDSASLVSLGHNEWDSTSLRFLLSFWLFTHVWCGNNAGLLFASRQNRWIIGLPVSTDVAELSLWSLHFWTLEQTEEGWGWKASPGQLVKGGLTHLSVPSQCSVFLTEPHTPQCFQLCLTSSSAP